MTTFVDRVVLHLAAGDGGHGCSSIHREKFKPLGGPDGGNGGRGGDVLLKVDADITTLLDYHHSPHRRASSGKPGQGGNKSGAEGQDLVLTVPNGTVVKTASGEVLADLVGAGTTYVAAQGGRGGLGNAALASARRKAPGFALLGEPGDSSDVVLELKTVADVALVGFPSAGKSSLVAALSAARPKIADYPFTTLVPNLGVVEAGEVRYTVADVPGLIPGASEGKGLGLEFLRHVERCSVLVHVVDAGTLEPGRDPMTDLDVIEAELAAYGGLDDRPRIVAHQQGRPARRPGPGRDGHRRPRGPRAAGLPDQRRGPDRACASCPSPWRTWSRRPGRRRRTSRRPASCCDRARSTRTSSRSSKQAERFLVLGHKPTRWVRQTDFSNDEAVGYLADRLARLGIEDALLAAGAQAGDEVVIGEGESGVVFDWEPTMQAGAELLHGRRGTDLRLEGR